MYVLYVYVSTRVCTRVCICVYVRGCVSRTGVHLHPPLPQDPLDPSTPVEILPPRARVGPETKDPRWDSWFRGLRSTPVASWPDEASSGYLGLRTDPWDRTGSRTSSRLRICLSRRRRQGSTESRVQSGPFRHRWSTGQTRPPSPNVKALCLGGGPSPTPSEQWQPTGGPWTERRVPRPYSVEGPGT